jgi:6-phosphogluconolactonase
MKMISRLAAVVLACFALPNWRAFAGDENSARSDLLVYVGTARYTGGVSKEILAYRFNPKTAELSSLGVAGEADNPGFLAIHPNQQYLYAVNETGNQQAMNGGSVSSFAIDSKTGKLKFLGKVPTHGAHPCHLIADKSGKYVVVVNYFGGAVESFPVKGDGQLGEAASVVRHTGSSVNKERQEAPHPHGVKVSPDSRFAIVADLGIDKLMIHRLSLKDGSLTPNNPPSAELSPGAGPRHLAFSPSGKFVFSVNELNSTVSAFARDLSTGSLRMIQTISTLPKDFKSENSGAEIEVSPGGKTLYVSNRGHNSIAVFSIDDTKGTLTPVEHVSTHGKTPRGFGIDPSGSHLIVGNQDTQNLVVFRIDAKTGRLSPVGHAVKTTSAPVYVGFAR